MIDFKSFFSKLTGKATAEKPKAPEPPAPPVQPTPPPPPAPPPPLQKEEPKSVAMSTGVTSQTGIDLIKQFEGCELTAYPDPGTGGDPWTIGYGHTGPDVVPGLTITEEEAERLLKADLKKFEKGVSDLLKVKVGQGQFDALVSFAYNCGLNNLKTSTLLKFCNAGDHRGAANQFPRWNKAAGKVMPGLTKRREAEKKLYLESMIATMITQ